jgi:[methyl-Co(III) methanol-specific corrinoid protein]:coenzyme M methyltransferase
MMFLRQLRKNPDAAHRVLAAVTDQLAEYARLMVENGAAVLSIADPTATGEILGPRLFETYAVPYLNQLIDAMHGMGARVILHICGDVRMVTAQLARIHQDALSADAMVSLRELKHALCIPVMGNVSTYLLESGKPEAAAQTAQGLVRGGIDIIAPACGLSTSTPLRSIQAMTGAVKDPQ